ncbi:MAG: glycosyltransferase family 2 protein, partial [Ignavibacteria bacterium]|nr:glycosyltransferase family 2 protein [Ignavibacteria bacterium]
MESLAIDKPFVAAVIPFYNPENIFRKVIEDTLPYVDKLILVNDGSTQKIDDLIVTDSKINLLEFEKNMGKGAALKRGINEALIFGSEFIITLDSDYQHEPGFIPLFLKALESSKFVIGKRNISFKQMPFLRVLSNTITSKVLSLKT